MSPNPIGTIGYICTIPMCFEPFVLSMIQITKHNAKAGLDVAYCSSTKGDQAQARNALVANFVGDWLMMVDTDMILPPDTFERMLNIAIENNLEVLGGTYCMRVSPHYPLAYTLVDSTFSYADIRRADGNLIKLDGAGTGCMLIKRTVFTKIKEHFKCEPFDFIPPLGEDFSFFKRLKALDIPLYLTTQVQCGHMRLQPIMYSDYLIANQGG